MSNLRPRSLFAIEDDGLVCRLQFSDSDEGEENNMEDLNSSAEFISPMKCLVSTPLPLTERNNRSLSTSDEERFNSSSDSVMSSAVIINRPPLKKRTGVKTRVDSTPPYRKVRALRLFESPQSPKTLLKQSELTSTDVKPTDPEMLTPKIEHYDKNHNRVTRGGGSLAVCSTNFLQFEPNVNPFYKSELYPFSNGKRRRDDSGYSRTPFNDSGDKFDSDVDADIQPNKRIFLGEGCLSRYESEFVELGQIGFGEYGSVFRCINKMDGCVYAIKKSKKPLKGTLDERTALNEVYAHAVLGQHKYVVRYYSAWAENDHMLIQNEYCNGGSLAQLIEDKRQQNVRFSEMDAKLILLQIASGLRYIHSLNLAHMDIKPANIFITRKPKLPLSPNSSDDGFEDGDFIEDDIIYKIGDLGHVTSLSSDIHGSEVEEGDCRYMPPELLADNYRHLPKADIFALALTIYEVCGGEPLPKNGVIWQGIRQGILPEIPISKEFRDLIDEMINPDPEKRPTSAALVQNQILVPYVCKTKEQLNKELTEERFKNQLLSKQLEKAAQTLEKRSTGNRLNRLIGGKTNRSHSVTNF